MQLKCFAYDYQGFTAVIVTYFLIFYALYSSVFIFLHSSLPIEYGIPGIIIMLMTSVMTFFLSTTGSESPCHPLSREFTNLTACSHASVCPGRHPDSSVEV
ncbi:hypothetical protein MXB_488 [Myxobolus squamalis]|nr:hypothetical protein MXB_488 [Myxobolus squamalis]